MTDLLSREEVAAVMGASDEEAWFDAAYGVCVAYAEGRLREVPDDAPRVTVREWDGDEGTAYYTPDAWLLVVDFPLADPHPSTVTPEGDQPSDQPGCRSLVPPPGTYMLVRVEEGADG